MALRELSLIVGTSASMKVPPKRKGNLSTYHLTTPQPKRLNESPSEKEGKFACKVTVDEFWKIASMKVPPKRKGNDRLQNEYGFTLAEPQ